jgi:hypothetical protein
MKKPDLRPLLQPDMSGTCGQTCVAMVAGVSLDEAFHAVGSTDLRMEGTVPEDIVRGLRKLGWYVGDYQVHGYKKKKLLRLPEFALLCLERTNDRWAHWVVIKGGFVYDPGIGYPLPVRVFEQSILELAYSRVYKRPQDASRRKMAYYAGVLPILGKLTKKRGRKHRGEQTASGHPARRVSRPVAPRGPEGQGNERGTGEARLEAASAGKAAHHRQRR